MSANIALSTAGVMLMYALETETDIMPTLDYIELPDVKGIPSTNPSPEGIESTIISEETCKTYIVGLKDMGGMLAFTVNLTPEFKDFWSTLIEKFYTQRSNGLGMWFCIKHPDLDKAVYFKGRPFELSLAEMNVNSVLETDVYILPLNNPLWDDIYEYLTLTDAELVPLTNADGEIFISK